MRKLIVASLVLACSASAFGAFTESEPNNTAALADPIALPCNVSADVGLANLAAGDSDYYSVFVPNGCILTAIITPLGSLPANFSTPDTIMQLRSPADVLITSNDDAGSGSDAVGGAAVGPVRGSAIRYLNTGAGASFFLRVIGFDAVTAGDYALTLSLIPEPATMSLLAGGLLLAARRARKA